MNEYVRRFLGDLQRGTELKVYHDPQDPTRPFILRVTKKNQIVQIQFDDSEDIWKIYCQAMEYWQHAYGEPDCV